MFRFISIIIISSIIIAMYGAPESGDRLVRAVQEGGARQESGSWL